MKQKNLNREGQKGSTQQGGIGQGQRQGQGQSQQGVRSDVNKQSGQKQNQ